MLRRFTRPMAVGLLMPVLHGCASSECSHVPAVHTVTPGVLIRGAQPGKRGLRELRDEFGIRTVVNFNDFTNKSEAKAATEIGLNYLPLNDDPFNDAGDRELVL